MKIITILGTRPEIIRLSLIIAKLDRLSDHRVIHTGQNYADSLNGIFFRDLGIRTPDEYLGIVAESPGEQIGRIIWEVERILVREKPDRVLILGDTNSGLSAIPAKRLGIPVFHMEAGNRCYDDRVPEELNRRIIDHSSSVLLPYTFRSKDNLVREGIERQRIFVTGNPIYEVLRFYEQSTSASRMLEDLGLEQRRYFLVTLHRAENVDDKIRLGQFISALENLARQFRMPVICSLHPRTQRKMAQFGIAQKETAVRFLTPLGFFDFVALEKKAFCVLSDSGTVQEECAIFGVPNVTLRDVTERPETMECGSNVLSGADENDILRLVTMVTAMATTWKPPLEYLEENVSDKVIRILVSHHLTLESKARPIQ